MIVAKSMQSPEDLISSYLLPGSLIAHKEHGIQEWGLVISNIDSTWIPSLANVCTQCRDSRLVAYECTYNYPGK